jgi:3-deoxy-D-manno-octulosonic-acid transferase
MFKPRTLYTLVLWLLLPYVFFHLLWRARKQPEYLRHIGERFGRYTVSSDKPVIWLHTVSVGETRAWPRSSRIARALSRTPILLTTPRRPAGRE